MENSDNREVKRWLITQLPAHFDQPLTDAALDFARKMMPGLGITSIPATNASTATPGNTGPTAMSNITPDETTLAGRAESRMQYEGKKQQRNLEAISFGALPFIKEDAKPNGIGDDWMSNYNDRSRLVSDEEMQQLWSHVLASEVNAPGSFSMRTVNLLASLNKEEALLFKKLCSYVWIDAGMTIETGSVAVLTVDMILKPKIYGLRMRDLFNLQDIGLINFYANQDISYALQSAGSMPIKFNYHDRKFELRGRSKEGEIIERVDNLNAGQVKLSYSGRELALICAPEVDYEYMNYITNFWREEGIDVTAL